eukprot:gnl/TRDRNA2_/TRDRNA2_174177_c9_seq6.p1 gnl/TRDRNA2_/TRDRNA2_174177_c9~~gnl/TRDRNA2_/TRDRNA2_174177_c9_seq6.p1  ORF type:complete len:149 (-),score=27.53 gnl/TRDRNA2_/TRDRNA2_174177_c9_seq6:80-484(-)
MAQNKKGQQVIRDEGGIQALIVVLHKGTQEAQAKAAGALWNLAVNVENKDVIREEGGMQALMNDLQNGSQHAQTSAADALRNLAESSQDKNVIRQKGAFRRLVRALHGCTQVIWFPLKIFRRRQNQDTGPLLRA